MSKSDEICSASYNIPFTNNKNEVFGTSCANLYNFIYINSNHVMISTNCKPMMLKMHLEFDGSPLMDEAEERSMEVDISNNDETQFVQQLEIKIKALQDALQQANYEANKLIDCIEKIQKISSVDKASDGGNNTTQDSNANNKQTYNENNLSGGEEQHNYTESVARASEENHTCTTVSEKKQKVLDLRHKCVYVQNFQCSDANLDRAFCNIRKLAIEMNAQIADNSVIHIDVIEKKKNYPDYYVYFRDAKSKNEFLKNRFIYKYNPKTGCLLRILDYSNYGIVDIKNYESSDLSLETAIVNVVELAKKMGMPDIKNFIDHIDVYSTKSNFLTYSVRFTSENLQNAFLRHKTILKDFPETKFLKISDAGGHTLSCDNLNNFSIAAASAVVIGVAELMGLSLSTDNFKRIYLLNTEGFSIFNKNLYISLDVEFSSNDIRNIFLKKYSKLKRIKNTWNSDLYISDIKTKQNIVNIGHTKESYNVCTAISFIGLAKQLGFSFTPDRIERFLELSEFISRASS